MFNTNSLKKLVLLLSISCTLLFVTGCNRDYTKSLNDYNSTINEAANTLTHYYNSLYELNRVLYFNQRRRLILPKERENSKINKDNIEITNDPHAENPLTVTAQNLEDLKISINALALYSKDLVTLYSDKLPQITYDTINSMSNDLKNVTAYTNYSEYSSNIAAAGNLVAEISKKILEGKRNKYVKAFVNRTSCTIKEFIEKLDKTNTNIQTVSVRAMELFLAHNINVYNTSIFKNDPHDVPEEILRQIRINNIERQYSLYVSLKKSDPKYLIEKLSTAQQELSDYVNGRTKDPKKLLNTLLEIKTILSLINRMIP